MTEELPVWILFTVPQRAYASFNNAKRGEIYVELFSSRRQFIKANGMSEAD